MNVPSTAIVNVAILTPYLLEDVRGKWPQSEIEKQIQRFGYDPQHILIDRILPTEHNLVKVEEEIIKRPHLVIAGCTQRVEQSISQKKGSGLLIARYSIFYGKVSNYSGKSPAVSGYAFDIPKNPQIIKALLREDRFLEALVFRDESKIRSSLESFNLRKDQPVLITEYLNEALRIQ